MIPWPDDEDGAVLAQLEASGIDMSLPLEIEFAIAAPDEPAALKIEQAASEAGYQAVACLDEGEPDDGDDIDVVIDSEFGPSWTVYVRKTIVPTHAAIIQIQQDLDRLASPFGGQSDGWGTMIDGDDEPA
jgi:regulator of RNase E activity RraB